MESFTLLQVTRQTVLFNILLNTILLTLNSAITIIPRNFANYKEPAHGHGKDSIIIGDELTRDINWSWKRSNHYKLGIILDSRWKSFSVAKVKNEKKTLIDIDAPSFQIPFSVLSSVDANVYLYDEMGRYVEIVFGSIITANCNNGCYKNTISMVGLVFNEWNHFILDIDNNSCDLKQCNNIDCQHVMKVISPYILKNMQVNSRKISLWKIHAYNFIYIASNSTTISKPFNYKKCISLHVRVCEHCTLSIDMYNVLCFTEKLHSSVIGRKHNSLRK